ncbi:Cytosolic carboxypeptidase Nna1 [Amphibalanus amphitrite]|uniref:Cytosolic carboxypeptidase Nna1 n=1 Tax=Amphibalanus amphitrite TaxID=1232801 RepID=A0A6A4VRI8_AMPAM|nr:Cytosolic carboxypeptidase Nna1 [Amphibalanus amphitrite]
MMRGILSFLTSRNRVAEVSDPTELLRQRFVFKIVPMLNPDGVIVGNSRCSLAGRDMNRQFKHTHRDLYPAVWHVKLLVRRLMEEAGVTVYCDFHGHSRRQNAFIYGCENRRNSSRYLTEKVFPFLLDRVAKNLFDFDSCQFSVHKSKEGTGRVVMWSMGITNAYTLEASSAGSSLRARAGTHYRAHDYELIGQRFCETLLDYVDTSPVKRVRERVMDTLREQYGYTDPADGSDSSSAEDSDEAGSSSKTRKASKKWRSKKFQSLLSWKKREKPQQTLTKITLRPPSERSLVGGDRGGCSPPAPRLVLQVGRGSSDRVLIWEQGCDLTLTFCDTLREKHRDISLEGCQLPIRPHLNVCVFYVVKLLSKSA